MPKHLLDEVQSSPEIALPLPIEAKGNWPSPFLPGTYIQYAWDSTCLGALKTCPRLYYYQIIEGWQARDESIHLRFGIEYHKTLEEYDRHRAAGMKHKKAMREAIRDLMIRVHDWKVDEDTKAGNYKNKRSIVAICIDYFDKFDGHDPAKTYIKADGKPAVELSFRFELDWGPEAAYIKDDSEMLGIHRPRIRDDYSQPYLLCGHLDRVVEFTDHLFVMDRKTSTTTLSEYYFNQYTPNNQMTLYTIAGKVILDTPINGVIIDGAQVLIEKPHDFQRGFTYRTQEQLDEWLGDLRYWFGLAETFATAKYWPMNDTACDKFGGCRFREVCSKAPKVRPIYLKSNFVQLAPEERWNPLRER